MKKSIIMACLPLLALTSCGAKALTLEEAQERYAAVKAKSQEVVPTNSYKFSVKVNEGVQDVAFTTSNDPEGNYSINVKAYVKVQGVEMNTNFKGVCLKAENACYLEVKATGISGKFKFTYDNDLIRPLSGFNWNMMAEGFIGQTDTLLSSLSGKVSGSKYTLVFDTASGEISIFVVDDLINKFVIEDGESKKTFSLAYLDKLTITAPKDASSYTAAPTA